MSPARNRRARIATAIAALTMTLGAAEICMRLLDLPRFDACETNPDYAIPDPELGFAPPPGGEVGGMPLNAMGWRGPLLEIPKPEGRQRILFLGDSTTWGLYLPIESTYASIATRALAAEQNHRDLEMLLGAFPGYSSYHAKVLLGRLLQFAPDLAVLYVGARNDGDRARYYADEQIPFRRARLDASWHQIRLLRSLEALADRSYRSLFRKLRSEADRARVPPEAFRRNVGETLDQLAEAGVAALVLIPPTSPEFAAKHALSARYRAILREVAASKEVPIVELQSLFAREDPAQTYHDDQYHFAERGHAITGQAVAQAISELGLLTTRGR